MQPNLVHRVVAVSAAGVVVVVATVVIVVEFVARPFVGIISELFCFISKSFVAAIFYSRRGPGIRNGDWFFIRNGIENNPLDS